MIIIRCCCFCCRQYNLSSIFVEYSIYLGIISGLFAFKMSIETNFENVYIGKRTKHRFWHTNWFWHTQRTCHECCRWMNTDNFVHFILYTIIRDIHFNRRNKTQVSYADIVVTELVLIFILFECIFSEADFKPISNWISEIRLHILNRITATPSTIKVKNQWIFSMVEAFVHLLRQYQNQKIISFQNIRCKGTHFFWFHSIPSYWLLTSMS